MKFNPTNSHDYVLIKTDATWTGNRQIVPGIESVNWGIEHLAGLVLSKQGATNHVLSDKNNSPLELSELLKTSGEWVALGKATTTDGDKYIAISDAYGYAPLFYSLIPGRGLFISDSFQGIAAGLTDLDVALQLDISYYVSMISARSSQFHNISSNRTMCEQIQILDVSSALYVDNSAVSIVNRSNLDENGSERSFESSLALGIEQTSEVLQSISQENDSKKRITLSGGVDSRLVLGLLQKAGVASEYQVLSDDPRLWENKSTVDVIQQDIAISNHIREDYGLSWWEGSSKTALSIDFIESLNFFQSFRSNFSYTFRPRSTHNMFSHGLITARGGGGEILRSTSGGAAAVTAFHEQYGERPNPDDKFFSWVAERYLQGSVTTDHFKNQPIDLLKEMLAGCTGRNSEQILNSFYFRTRNRAHFGHSRIDFSKNDIVLQLLSNPFFLKASKQLDFDERANGRLVRELFDKTVPSLRGYNFESRVWTQKLSISNHKNISSNDSSWMDSFDAISKISDEPVFARGWQRGQRGESFRFNAITSAINYVRRATFAIESYYSGSDLDELRKQHVRVVNAASNGYLNLNITVAKLASAIDVLFPRKSRVNAVVYNTNKSVEQRLVEQNVSLSYPAVVSDGWQNDPIFEHACILSESEEGFVATMRLTSSTIRQMEYAFYLQHNGETVEQKWYGHDQSVRFKIDPKLSGSYRSISFVRPRGFAGPIYQVLSNEVLI